jgi:hypothetical protein
MTTPLRVAVLVTVGALVIAGALIAVGSSRLPSVAPTVGPSATSSATSSPAASQRPDASSATAGRTPSPLSGSTSLAFDHPFSYELPAGAGIVVGTDIHDVALLRVPIAGTADQWGNTIGVRSVTGGRENPCVDSQAVDIGPGAQAVVDYLDAISTLDVSPTEALTVDGKPALRFTMTPHGPTDSCADLWLWAAPGSYTQNASWDTSAEITVVDVGDSHIVILVFGDGAWRETAHEVIDSFDFVD